MRQALVFILLATLLTSCGQERVKEREGEPDIYTVDSDDKEMNEAILKSRATFKDFDAAFEKGDAGQTDFAVKVKFLTENGGEHIWLSGIKKNDGKYYGTIDNLPEEVPSVQLGQTIEIDPANISDWVYVDNGKLVGGFTIRLLRDRMTPEERKQLDEEFGVKIE